MPNFFELMDQFYTKLISRDFFVTKFLDYVAILYYWISNQGSFNVRIYLYKVNNLVTATVNLDCVIINGF